MMLIFILLLLQAAIFTNGDVCSLRSDTYDNITPLRQYCQSRLHSLGIDSMHNVASFNGTLFYINGATTPLETSTQANVYISSMYDGSTSPLDKVWCTITYAAFVGDVIQIDSVTPLDSVEGAPNQYILNDQWTYFDCNTLGYGGSSYVYWDTSSNAARCTCQLNHQLNNQGVCVPGCSPTSNIDGTFSGVCGINCDTPTRNGIATINQYTRYVTTSCQNVCMYDYSTYYGECMPPTIQYFLPIANEGPTTVEPSSASDVTTIDPKMSIILSTVTLSLLILLFMIIGCLPQCTKQAVDKDQQIHLTVTNSDRSQSSRTANTTQ